MHRSGPNRKGESRCIVVDNHDLVDTDGAYRGFTADDRPEAQVDVFIALGGNVINDVDRQLPDGPITRPGCKDHRRGREDVVVHVIGRTGA